MRDVRSRNYFEQMKGRGTRTLMDVIEEKAKRDPCTDNPIGEQLSTAKTELIKAAIEAFHDPEKRDFIENVRRSHDQIIDNVNLEQPHSENQDIPDFIQNAR